MKFTNNKISVATVKDISQIVLLLNSAYRGDASRKGWTTEADLIAGDVRTNEQQVQDVMQQEGSVFLKYEEAGEIIGCVNLQQHDDKIYLGMFSVQPGLQGGGIGKELMKAAEEYALQKNIHFIYMSVISVRKELIDWYKRRGYYETGERKIFNEDGITGRHLQPLEFMILEKKLVTAE